MGENGVKGNGVWGKGECRKERRNGAERNGMWVIEEGM